MKKLWLILVVFSIISCDNKLSDEQRKAMREQMELHKIRKISEAQITEAAYLSGRSIVQKLDAAGSDSIKLKSLLNAYKGHVRLITPSNHNAVIMEQQLLDAYLANESGLTQDNIQKIRDKNNVETDSILYTKPIVLKLPDGSVKLQGMWSVWLSKKEVVLSIK